MPVRKFKVALYISDQSEHNLFTNNGLLVNEVQTNETLFQMY